MIYIVPKGPCSYTLYDSKEELINLGSFDTIDDIGYTDEPWLVLAEYRPNISFIIPEAYFK